MPDLKGSSVTDSANLGMDILTIYLHYLIVHTTNIASSSQYLPIEKDALRWGLHVMDAGSTVIPKNSDYPLGRHPDEYLFSWDKGRTLQEYQLVYITRGRGHFETAQVGRKRIEAGQVFILHPGVWHRYRPVKTQGWDQHWIGFHGEVAKRIMEDFFPANKAVMRVGYDQELLDVISSIPDLMQQATAGYQQIMAARTMEALSLIRSRAMSYHDADRTVSRKVQQARYFLLEHCAEDIAMGDLARQLGLSYSRFRSMFKEHTGTAPHQYQLDIRMNKARDLLLHSKRSISEISDHLGFSSAYYFSRLFKKRNGCSPSEYRKM